MLAVFTQIRPTLGLIVVSLSVFMSPLASSAKPTLPAPVAVSAGWQLQDVAKVPQAGAEVSAAAFKTAGWYAATVPGTVLTTLVEQPRLSRAALRREQPPRNHPREPGAHLVLVPDHDRRSKVLQGPARLAQLRRHQLLIDRVGQRRAGGHNRAAPSSAASSTLRLT